MGVCHYVEDRDAGALQKMKWPEGAREGKGEDVSSVDGVNLKARSADYPYLKGNTARDPARPSVRIAPFQSLKMVPDNVTVPFQTFRRSQKSSRNECESRKA